MTIKATYRALNDAPPPGLPALDPRKRGVILQLAAVAGALGYEPEQFAVQVATVQHRRFEEVIGFMSGASLLETVIHGVFEYIAGYTEHGSPQRIRASLAQLMDDWPAELDVTEAGCRLERGSRPPEMKLYVNWAAAVKGPLAGTRFARMTPRALTRLAKTLPEYRGQVRHYLNRRQARCTLLEVAAPRSVGPTGT